MKYRSIRVALVLGGVTTWLVSATTWIQAQRDANAGWEHVDGRDVVAREVLVKFRVTPRTDQLNQIRALIDGDTIQTIGRTGTRRLRSRSLTAAAALRRLADHPDILYAEPNFIVHAFTEPNDPSFPQLWGLKNIGQAVNGGGPGLAGADIHAEPAWNVSLGSTAQVVAVVDTGIDYTHPDLAANMWSAPSAFTVTIGGVPITCAAGTHGFNAITSACDPMDDFNHGTHVSGTIGASGQNGVGVVGVNWITRLMGIKFLDANGSGTVAGAVSGIEFAILAKRAFAATGGANVRVLSNSWGGSEFSQTLLDEIAAAGRDDMLFVAAAGNNGFTNDVLPTYPASYNLPNIIAVAATTNTDGRAYFSNYGAASVHLGAPGVDVLSTTIGNTYAYFSGTSMATPHVSGSAALVLSRCALDTAGLKDALLGTVEPVPALASITITGGRLDVNSAIRSCMAPPATPTGLAAVAGDSKVTLTWSGVAGATGFATKRSLTPGGPYAIVAPGIKGKTYTDTAVVNGTTYYYVVSAANPLGESANSNEAAATPKIASDLVVSALTVPSTGGAGATLTLLDTTKNQGIGTADPSTTRFYLSRTSTINASAILLDGAHLVPSLSPGAASSASVPIDIPTDVGVGSYFIVARADADGVENERQESNNTLARLLTIGPDLVVSSLTVQATAAPGGTIALTDTVKNQGGGAAGATATLFYLSVDSILGSGDLLLQANRPVPDLNAGGASTGSTTALIPSTVATGSYFVIAKADADNAVVETQESNNTSNRSVRIGGDLIVSALTVPATAGAGSAIVIGDTTRNQGGGAIAASVTRFYLSTNAAFDAADLLLSGGREVPELAAGSSSAGSTTVTIPATVGVGTYYIVANADADQAVVETQETNNTTLRYTQIGGDFVVSALTIPNKGAAGGTILVTETTSNQGGGAVPASVTRFYLSTNPVFDESDTLLPGDRSVPALAAVTGNAGSTPVTIPSVAAGTYYVIAMADADRSVVETQEANNTAARSITIGPDLVIVNTSAAPTTAAGSTVAVTDVVQNQGAGGSGASTTRFYLSANAALDANDVLLAGSRAVPPLAAGASSSGSAPVTIPPGTAPGNYYLFARADADGEVAEGQETNNTRLREIQVTTGP